MGKQTPQEYPNRVTLSIADIQGEVLRLVNYTHGETYIDDLNYLLDSFLNLINSSKFQGGYNGFYNVYQDDIKKTVKNIKTCVRYFLQGKISSAYNSFNLRWKDLWYDEYTPNVHTIQKGDFWYKIRKVEKTPFYERKDFFHIPFEQREIIGNNRYSISGYPCLYLGKSIYTCWEELRRPKLSELSAIAFRVEEPLKLLDMRLIQMINSDEKEWYNIRLLPYILASSIKVHVDEGNFKPEYIIPQLILHTVVKNNAYDGVIFTSTRRGMPCNKSNIGIYDNLAIPVSSCRTKGYCRTLASHFYASMPIYYEHEYLQGHLCGDISNHSKSYKNSVFYSLENILKSKPFNNIINSR